MTSERTEPESNKFMAIAGTLWNVAVKVAAVVLSWIWRKSRIVCRYYWERRQNFWQHFTEYARDLRPERFVTREIRISSEEQYLNAEFDGDTWKVRLPKMCVVCGAPGEGAPLAENYQVENLTAPFWSVVAGTLAGFVLWMLVWNWFFPIGIVLGFAIGYGRHATVNVKIKQWKCEKHRESTRFPRLRTFADFLIISVGSKELRQEFRHQRSGDRGDYGSNAPVETYVPAATTDHQTPPIEPIPLADEAHDSIEIDRRERLDPSTIKDTEPPPL